MTDSRTAITLIGEEIVGSWTVEALGDSGEVLGGSYLFYDGAVESAANSEQIPVLSRFDCLMAAENLPEAKNIYSFRPPRTGRHALLVGNEAKGLRRRTRKQAHVIVEIPLVSRNINCLNVAAAAAVLLYNLSQEQPLNTKQRSLTNIRQNRPGLLFIGGSSPMAVGTSIRSAYTFQLP